MLITQQVKMEKPSEYHTAYVAGKPIISKDNLFAAPKSTAFNCARHVVINMREVQQVKSKLIQVNIQFQFIYEHSFKTSY